VNKLIKYFLKNLSYTQGAKLPLRSYWNQSFFQLTWMAISLQSLHVFPRPQPRPFPLHPSQSKVLWTKDTDNIRPQARKYHLSSGTGLKLPLSSQNLINKPCLKSL